MRREYLEALGAEIRAQRERAGMTQRQLAEKLGRSQGSVSLLEAGARAADIATLKSIADAVHPGDDDRRACFARLCELAGQVEAA